MLEVERAVLFLHDQSPLRRNPVVSAHLLALLVSREPVHQRAEGDSSIYVYEVERAEIARTEAMGDPQRQRELVELAAGLRGLSARLGARRTRRGLPTSARRARSASPSASA